MWSTWATLHVQCGHNTFNVGGRGKRKCSSINLALCLNHQPQKTKICKNQRKNASVDGPLGCSEIVVNIFDLAPHNHNVHTQIQYVHI